jgi:uncharacterized lipoprotein YajG
MKISNSNSTKFFVVMALSFLMFTSCNREPIPEGMPKLYSSKVIITQSGNRLDGASVILFNLDVPQAPWVVGGVTDSNGVCTLKTLGKFNGAPVGKYKITVIKTTTTPSETSKLPVPTDQQAQEEYYAKIQKEEKHYNHVNLKYQLPTTTDLEIEIIAGKNEKTFDVGEAIKEEIKLIP